MTILVLALLGFAETRTWTGTPVWKASAASAAHLRTVFHTVEIVLTKDTVTTKTKTLFKNTRDKPLAGSILVPVYGNGEYPGALPVMAKFGEGSVTPSPGVAGQWTNENSRASSRGFKVTFKPGEWKSFESTMTRPLPKAGEGNAERLVLYETMDDTDRLEQFQIAVKYPKGFVFQTVSTRPPGWQVGETGAWWSAKDWLPKHTIFQFRFYPGTFERIGG